MKTLDVLAAVLIGMCLALGFVYGFSDERGDVPALEMKE